MTAPTVPVGAGWNAAADDIGVRDDLNAPVWKVDRHQPQKQTLPVGIGVGGKEVKEVNPRRLLEQSPATLSRSRPQGGPAQLLGRQLDARAAS